MFVCVVVLLFYLLRFSRHGCFVLFMQLLCREAAIALYGCTAFLPGLIVLWYNSAVLCNTLRP